MRALLAAAALWLGCAAAAFAAPAQIVDYRLSPELKNGRLTALAIRISFRGAGSGRTVLALPEGYGSAGKDGWRAVHDLKIDGATSVETPEPGRRVIAARPAAALVVSYRVVPTQDHDPKMEEIEEYRPIIRPTWFEAVGSSLFARPFADDDSEATPVRFDWAGPADMPFASDLEAVAGERRPGTKRGTLRDIRTGVVIGGRDLTVAHSGAVRLAMIHADVFSLPPATLAEFAGRILHAERAFWGDPDAPFLVTMAPVITPSPLSKFVNGTGRSAGFATLVSTNVTLTDLAALFAHENFHTWNSPQLGGQGYEGPRGAGLWFSEGFTDFYTRRLLARSGVLAPEAVADIWNNMLIAYAASPARTLTNDEAADGFWTNPFAQKALYQRGAMLAAIWDARLRAQSGGRVSLDDVMRAQRKAAVEAGRSTTAAKLFPVVAARFGLDVQADLDRYVDRGEPIELPADVFGPCARVSWREQATFDRGWDTKATSAAGGVVTGLREGSPAWRAGIRDGMRIVGRSFDHPDDSTVEQMIRVRTTDGAEREVRFKPEGEGQLKVQHVDVAACATAASF